MGKRSYIPKEKATIAMMKTTKDGVQAKKKDNKTKSIVEVEGSTSSPEATATGT